MICLTDEQFEILEIQLKNSGIARPGLYHDLLDHYYCLTIQYMDEGLSFETALNQAGNELAPEGFASLSQEVELFIQFPIQLRMNRILYSGAFLAATGQTLYVLFRNLHWPGANTCLLVAVFALFSFVVPVLVLKFRAGYQSQTLFRKWRFISGILAISLFGMGSVFKIFHLPGANIQIVLGTTLLAILFFPLYFLEMYRHAMQENQGQTSPAV